MGLAESVTEHQGLTIRQLAAGLAPHRVLPAELGPGQIQLLLAQGVLEQPLPFVQHAGAGLLGPLSRGREVPHEGRCSAAGRHVHPHVVGQTPLFTQQHEQPAGHPQPQMGLQHAQGQGVPMAQGHGGATQHQHKLFGVLVLHTQALARLGTRALLPAGCAGAQGLRLQAGFQGRQGGLLQIAAEHQQGSFPSQAFHQGLELGGLQALKVVLHAEGIVAIGPLAIELLAQAVVGQLKGILLLALQVLQVQVPLQVHLGRLQGGGAGHERQQRQEIGGIVAGALQADHQGVLAGFRPQGCPPPLHQLRQAVRIQRPGPAGHRAGQQLHGAALPLGVLAAAAADPQPGGQQAGPSPLQHHQGQAPWQGGSSPGAGHAGTASSTQARSGASHGPHWRCRSSLCHCSRTCRGSSRLHGCCHSWLLARAAATPPADSRAKR